MHASDSQSPARDRRGLVSAGPRRVASRSRSRSRSSRTRTDSEVAGC
jgi:hypothetical protein